MMEIKKLKKSELKDYRLKLLKKYPYCEICGIKLTEKNAVIDHIHKEHKSMYPETTTLIRGLICSDCNIILGKIENQFLRSSREYKEKNKLPDILNNMSKYIKKYSKLENIETPLIHPREWKPLKIKKSSFNKFKKQIKDIYNIDIQYPKSGKLTKRIKELSEKINFEFEFY